MHLVIAMLLIPFGILNVVCKLSLISLIDFTDGCCIIDIICALQSDIRAVKEYTSDLQTFLGSKVIEGENKKEEENLMALSEDGCLQQLNLIYTINTKIQDIVSTIIKDNESIVVKPIGKY
jgi:hypothetical protein